MYYTQEQLEKIGFKSVGKNVKISDKCSIYGSGNISLGNNVRIDDFSILSAGSLGIEIGDYVHISCYVSIVGQGKVIMADYSALSSKVSVFSSGDNYDGEWMTNPCLPNHVTNTHHKDVYIGKHVVVGAGSVVLAGVYLADGCAVGAMSLVRDSYYAPYVVAGIPSKFIRRRKLNIFELEKTIDL